MNLYYEDIDKVSFRSSYRTLVHYWHSRTYQKSRNRQKKPFDYNLGPLIRRSYFYIFLPVNQVWEEEFKRHIEQLAVSQTKG